MSPKHFRATETMEIFYPVHPVNAAQTIMSDDKCLGLGEMEAQLEGRSDSGRRPRLGLHAPEDINTISYGIQKVLHTAVSKSYYDNKTFS